MSLQLLFRTPTRASCINGVRVSGIVSKSISFSHVAPHRQDRASPYLTSTPSKKDHDGPKQSPPRGSIRPFTVLFLCVPLGYGANWALKKQSVAEQASPDGFVKYTLASKEDVSSTCSIFILRPSAPLAAIDVHAPELRRSITSVQLKQPQLQIARSYTLLPPAEGQNGNELRFLIKREQRGEVSGYLHRLPLNAEVEVRGVSREYVVPDDVRKVLFLAGGTGIAPALQVANILKDDKADMHILWANRRREDCAGGKSDTRRDTGAASWWDFSRLWSASGASSSIVSTDALELTRSQHPIVGELLVSAGKGSIDAAGPKVNVDYFVDEEASFIQPRDLSHLVSQTTQAKKVLVVSGPEGFVNYWAGPKQWLNGREVQGPLAGVLGGVETTGWEIVKL